MNDHITANHRVRNVVSDSGRASVQSFFNAYIPKEIKPMPILGYGESAHLDMQVAAVFGDSKEVLGAVHWAIDFEDSMSMEDRGETEMSDRFSRLVRILQNVAVADVHRSSGVGRALVTYLEVRVRAQGVELVIGVASSTESAQFFDRLGYTVLNENEDLQIPLAENMMVRLPLTGTAFRWFWKYLEQSPATASSPRAPIHVA